MGVTHRLVIDKLDRGEELELVVEVLDHHANRHAEHERTEPSPRDELHLERHGRLRPKAGRPPFAPPAAAPVPVSDLVLFVLRMAGLALALEPFGLVCARTVVGSRAVVMVHFVGHRPAEIA